MSEPHRPESVVRARRWAFLSSAALVVGAATVAAVLSAGADARSAATPSNVSPPTVSGTAVVGETLTASEGSWTGGPFTLTYQWVALRRRRRAPRRLGLLHHRRRNSDELPRRRRRWRRHRLQATRSRDGNEPRRHPERRLGTYGHRQCADAAREHRRAGHLGVGRRRVDAQRLTGHVDRHVDHVRIPVGALRCRRRAPRCLRLRLDPGSHDLQLHARLRRHRAAAPRPGHRDERSPPSATVASNPTALVQQSPATGPPRNLVEPSISGTFTVGRILLASLGTWAGVTPLSYAYQWVRCGADGGLPDGSNCTPVSGATTSSYTLTVDDVGQRIRIRITASNSLGAQTTASNASAAVTATSSTNPAPQAPSNSVLPSILGSATVGTTLTASTGLWTGTAPLLYSYQWLRLRRGRRSVDWCGLLGDLRRDGHPVRAGRRRPRPASPDAGDRS